MLVTGFNSLQPSYQEMSYPHNVDAAVVTIRVKWVPHPEDGTTHGLAQQSWLFKVKRVSLDVSFCQIWSQIVCIARFP